MKMIESLAVVGIGILKVLGPVSRLLQYAEICGGSILHLETHIKILRNKR